MEQITEDFVSPQLAKLLAAKGFDVPTLRFYDSQDIPCVSGRNEPFNWNEFKDSRCPSFSRPTVQMVIKWLRIKHNLIIVIDYGKWERYENTDTLIGYVFSIMKTENPTDVFYMSDYAYPTHEEATDAAIIHCLTEIIEPKTNKKHI